MTERASPRAGTRPARRRSSGAPLGVLGAVAVLAATSSCGPTRPYVWVGSLPPDRMERIIQAGDQIGVLVQKQDSLSGTFTVLENGTYAQPVVGAVSVAGLSEAEASEKLAGLLEGIVVEPRVTVAVVQPRPVRVSVTGEVQSSGVYTMPHDSTVLAVLASAGGLTPFADRDGIYLIRTRPELIRVRFRYEDLAAAEPSSTLFRLHDGDVIVVE